VGVAIANRHIKRLHSAISGEEFVPAMDFYSLMSASEEALFAYDLGESFLQREGSESARAEFEHCLSLARKAGNKVVMLKAFIGLYRSGGTVNVDEVKKALASIQGDAYRAIEAEVLRALIKADGRHRIVPVPPGEGNVSDR